jgi:NADH:ubiquinone oxidoreductase subunit E
MSVRLVLCGICTPNLPPVYETVRQLQREYSNDLIVVEVDCMAACDESPAVMLGHDYHPVVTAAQLRELVEQSLATGSAGSA